MNADLNRRRVETIQRVCSALSADDMDGGRSFIIEEYPFMPRARQARYYSDFKKLEIFMRDGFIDRYSGERLVFPGVLKVLSSTYPGEFPYHKNGKMTLGHMAYWHLLPMIDHVEPHAAGGRNEDGNLVSTSMMNNLVKSNYTLEELGWELHPVGDIEHWDGLTGWFRNYVGDHQHLLKDQYIDKWYRALNRWDGR